MRTCASPCSRIWVLWGAAAALLALGACHKSKPITTEPPPASTRPQPPERRYDYPHRVEPQPAVDDAAAGPERKPVVALLRTDDLVGLGTAVPFGRRNVVAVRDASGVTQELALEGKDDAPVLLPPDIRQFLLKELVDSGPLIVVDRERILEILREQEFSKGPHVDQPSAPKSGRLLGVHYILEAAFFPAGSSPAAHSVWAGLDKLHGLRRSAPVEQTAVVYVSAYDVETGVITAIGFGADASHVRATRAAVRDVVKQLARAHPPIRVVRYDDRGNPVLDIGQLSGVKNGDTWRARGVSGEEQELETWQVDPLTCLARFLRGTPTDLPVGATVHRPPDPASEGRTDG